MSNIPDNKTPKLSSSIVSDPSCDGDLLNDRAVLDCVSATHRAGMFQERGFVRSKSFDVKPKKKLPIARRPIPLGCQRIARRRVAGATVRRAPFSICDLSPFVAAAAPNLAVVSVIFLLLFIIM